MCGLKDCEFCSDCDNVDADNEEAVRSVHVALGFDATGDFCSLELVTCEPGGYEITVPTRAAVGQRFEVVFAGCFSQMRKLFARSAGFEGTLPASLSAAVGMRHFDVSYNQLSGPLSAEYAAWTALTEFNVGGNQISGELP